MRFVIFGAGAIGGVVGARLHQAGEAVQLIARGAHHDAIAARGLTLETPIERLTQSIPVAPTAAAAGLTAGDVILLAVKTQDTVDALDALRDAAPAPVPVVCLQNGVENERLAARIFPDVYGAAVMTPTAHLQPGTVQAYATNVTGAIDIGRYPRGIDDLGIEICRALAGAHWESAPQDDVMRHKHAKLLANLGNAIEVVCGPGADGSDELAGRARAEARAVLDACGIAYDAPDVENVAARWQRWAVGEIAGRPRPGGSSWQSVVRGTGRIETDYLTGEIVLRGRQAGVDTPVNTLLQALARQTVAAGRTPGWVSAPEILARLG